MAITEGNEYNHLQELGGSKFEIVTGEPNIKHWDVKTSSGEMIGNVAELLFNPDTRKVHYLVVDLEKSMLNIASDKKVLVPIGIAEIHNQDDEVVLPGITATQLNALPAYEKGRVTPEMEATIRRIFETGSVLSGVGAATAASYDKDQFYEHDHFNEDKFFNSRNSNQKISSVPVIEETLEVGKKEVQTGTTRLTSRIVERQVEAQVDLCQEHIVVNRTPVDRPASSVDLNAFQDKNIEMTGHAEVPIVTKTARVVEEVSLNKEVETREETVRDTVRKTEVEADKIVPKSGTTDSNLN